jgi:DNA-binding NtrC family response regulator
MATNTQYEELYSQSLIPEPSAQEGTVLVVDDDVSTRRFIRTLLTSMTNAIVLDAGDADSAMCIALTLDRPVNLLITDIDLGGRDGIDLAAELSSLTPAMKVLLISGNDARRRGIPPEWRFLAKPFAIAKLIEFVEGALKTGTA